MSNPAMLDLTGRKFGQLTAEEMIGSRTYGRAGRTVTRVWRCRCECGASCEVTAQHLTRAVRPTQSCGCCGHKNNLPDRAVAVATGHRSGKLVAVEPAGSDAHGNRLWHCDCDCGRKPVVRAANLAAFRSKSCGCANGRPPS